MFTGANRTVRTVDTNDLKNYTRESALWVRRRCHFIRKTKNSLNGNSVNLIVLCIRIVSSENLYTDYVVNTVTRISTLYFDTSDDAMIDERILRPNM